VGKSQKKKKKERNIQGARTEGINWVRATQLKRHHKNEGFAGDEKLDVAPKNHLPISCSGKKGKSARAEGKKGNEKWDRRPTAQVNGEGVPAWPLPPNLKKGLRVGGKVRVADAKNTTVKKRQNENSKE